MVTAPTATATYADAVQGLLLRGKVAALQQVRREAVGRVAVPYVVQPGDTLTAIARRFEVPLGRLRAANREITDDRLFVGQILEIPLTEPTLPPLPEVYEPFIVQPGDTLASIAERFGIFVEALRAANPGVDPENLIAGTIVFVPMVAEPAPVPLVALLYVVQRGDTLARIAAAFEVSLADLRAANPQLQGDEIFAGEILVIPIPSVPLEPVFTRIRYIVQPGDTLASIARQFGVTVPGIEQLNVFAAPIAGLILAVPMAIPIPAPPPAPPGFPTCVPPPFGRRLE
ncbi:MAG TPA: LysM peptidoglycan-binding domain-containing protein, partial [Bacillota bacterium]